MPQNFQVERNNYAELNENALSIQNSGSPKTNPPGTEGHT